MSTKQTVKEEAASKAADQKDKALESFSGGLAQLKHIRFHRRDGIGPETTKRLDEFIAQSQKMVEDLAEMDVTL